MGNRPIEPRTRRIPILTTDTLGTTPIRYGATLHGVAISGANVLRDLREAVTNTLGGKMIRYEKLLDQTIDRAIDTIEERAIATGYDAIIGLRISHPVITDGAIEVVVVGTGIWLDDRQN